MIENKTIQEMNEAIAIFMGAEKYEYEVKHIHKLFHFYSGFPFEIRSIKRNDKNIIDARDLKYHLSWDWLMPVVEKIEKDFKYEVSIFHKVCLIGKADYPMDTYSTIIGVDATIASTKLEAVFLAVSDFCKYYVKTKEDHAEEEK